MKAPPITDLRIQLEQLDDYQGQPTFRIGTPTATYFYHRYGGALASLIDPDGRDWISFRPRGGSNGKFRGIPNTIHPEVGFHPGGAFCDSRVISQTPDALVIESESNDGKWACSWRFLADGAVMALTRAAREHWLLYEGTPGGDYHEKEAFMIDGSGHVEPGNARWERRLPEPRGICFGTARSSYGLYLIDATERGESVIDSYWSMQKNMTVFGFGRSLNKSTSQRWKRLTETPATLILALDPIPDHGAVATRIAEFVVHHSKRPAG